MVRHGAPPIGGPAARAGAATGCATSRQVLTWRHLVAGDDGRRESKGTGVPKRACTDAPEWLSKGEAAQRLGCSPRTVERWAAKGWLRRSYFGVRMRVDAADVERLRVEGTPG